MTGPAVTDYHAKWLETAERRGVPAAVVAEIARRHGITARSFAVLARLTEINDPHGKSFFLLPRGSTGEDARNAALMTYIVNAGTGYSSAAERPADFAETPYGADEVQRIIDRQRANSWSYDQDVEFVDGNGGRLVTTPNGMLIGLGGNWIQRQFSRQGGTAWGDIFMVNIDDDGTPAHRLRQIVQSGHSWYADRKGRPFESRLALDRVLHHEELHSQQWAAKGHARMITAYIWEVIRDKAFRKANRLEEAAGLADGGYR